MKSFYDLGDDLYAEGQYELAFEKFKMALESSEVNESECLNYMGCAQIALGNNLYAIELFNDALKLSPHWERLYFNKARALFEVGDKVDSEALFKRAVMLNSMEEDVHFYLGVFYKKTKDYQQAIQWFSSSLAINDEQPEAHILLGHVYWIIGLDDKALQEFDLALGYDSDYVDAAYNKALIFQEQKLYSEAILLYKQVLDKRQTDTEVMLELARCYFKLSRIDNCKQYLKRVLKVEPDNTKALRLIKFVNSKINQ